MTDIEIIKVELECVQSDCHNRDNRVCDNCRLALPSANIIRAYNNAIKALEKNGIQWHNLRKEPNDLPDKYRYVIAIFYDCLHDEIKPCIARLRDDSEWEVNGQVYSNVVAWTEIPQFFKDF